jgi:hypothetical protein
MPATYSLDLTGTATSNKVILEQHVTTIFNNRDYYFIVPTFAPFFVDGLHVFHTINGTTTELIKGADFNEVVPFIGASRSIGKSVYGAISINNLKKNGIITVTYQTLGGPYCVDENFVLNQLAELGYNPRLISWEHIAQLPEKFPPVPHQWDLIDMVGEQEIVDALHAIEEAIASTPSNEQLANHITNMDNPHDVTRAQVGLSLLQNLSIASGSEITTVMEAPSSATDLSEIITDPPLLNRYLTLNNLLFIRQFIGTNGGGGVTYTGPRIKTITTFNSTNNGFDVPDGYTANKLSVYVNGVLLIPGIDYIATNGTTVTLNSFVLTPVSPGADNDTVVTIAY